MRDDKDIKDTEYEEVEDGSAENNEADRDETENEAVEAEDNDDETELFDQDGKPVKSEKKEGKKLPTWGKVMIIVGSVILVLAIAVWVGIKIYLGRINRIEERSRTPREQETFEASSGDGEDTISADEVKWDELYEQVKQDKDVKNIILIGQDRRPTETEPARSDSMILCSINKKTNKITLISFMRDMYVPIEGYSDNRINAAYNYGGASLLKETLQKDFGVGEALDLLDAGELHFFAGIETHILVHVHPPISSMCSIVCGGAEG